MRGMKDESKPMEPLFPKMRIDDFYQGQPKAPPRIKMVSCENYNVASPSQRLSSGSTEMLNFQLSTSRKGSVVEPEQLTASSVSDAYEPVFPKIYGFPGPSHLAERNRSTGVKFNTTLLKPEPRLSDHSNFLRKRVPGNLMLTTEPNDFKVFRVSSVVEDHSQIPTYKREGMVKKDDDHLLHLYKELNTSCSPAFEKRRCVILKQGNERGGDKLRDHQGNHGERQYKFNSKGHFRDPVLVLPAEGRTSAFRPFIPLAGNNATYQDAKLLKIFDHGEKCILGDKPSTCCYKTLESEIAKDDTSSVPEKVTRERCVSASDGTQSLQSPGDISAVIKIEKDNIEEVAIAEKKQEVSHTCEKSISLCIIPDEIIGAMGGPLFCKARETMVLHQRIFAIQVFELHRLFQVQKILSKSPDLLYKNRFLCDERSIKFPPTDKLLYMAPLHPSPLLPKPKINVQTSYPCRKYGIEPSWGNIPPPIVHTENGNLTQPSTSKTFPHTNTARCHFPTPGNQWLLPVKSSSEGLIYKPYTGPYSPNLGLVTPVYGNCRPISSNPIGHTAYCVSSLNQHEPGQSSGTGLGQSCVQPYSMSSNLEIEKMKQFSGYDNKHWSNLSMNSSIQRQSSSDMLSQKSIVSDSSGNVSGIRDGNMKELSENCTTVHEVVALPLFPTTPDIVSIRHCKEEKARAIKAVPHTHQSILESTARILEAIEEGKKQLFE